MGVKMHRYVMTERVEDVIRKLTAGKDTKAMSEEQREFIDDLRYLADVLNPASPSPEESLLSESDIDTLADELFF